MYHILYIGINDKYRHIYKICVAFICWPYLDKNLSIEVSILVFMMRTSHEAPIHY